MKGTKQIYMKYYSKKQWTQKLTVMVLLSMALGGTAVQAMPSGADIRSGQGAISQDGKNMTVQQNSQRMAIDWTKFDIAKDETVRYAQPDRNAISLNRVTGGQQSVIAGNLNANGNVVLVNPNGVVFTKNSSVDVGGLVASTARLNDEAMKNFSNGKDSLGLSLDKDSTAAVINEGQIKAQGGLVALHAANVENKGTITNEGGTLAMAAAKNLTLSAADDDKLNFTVDGELAKSQALNSGSLKADGGYVVMTAKSAGDVLSTVVNNTGTIEAKTLRKNEKGQILLDGGDNGQVEVSGTLNASGTEEGQSAGNIKVIGEKTIVHDGTNLLARGNVDGGKIETSGDVLNLGDTLNIDAKGVNGKAGEWLLDPLDVIIADSDPTTTSNYDKADKKTAADSDFTEGSASIGYNDPAATDANVSSVNSAVTWISTAMVEKMLNENTNVTIQAAATKGSANIIVKNDIEKTAGDDATFTLDAMRNITINGNISSKFNKLNVVLNADSNGDQIGAVIINADINTNGGYFTSASGGTVTYSDKANTKGYGNGTLSGKADPAGHTVGTYFGHVNDDGTADGKKDDRLIQTKGGKITLNGEIAIGLNGGTLTLDSGGGAVTATGIINSGNSYGAYVYGTDTWNTLVEQTVESYLKEGKVPAYHYQGVNYVKNADGTYQYTTDAQGFSNGQPHYTFSEADTQNVRWLGDGSSTSVSTSAGTGYASVVITKGSMTLEQWLNYQLTYNAANFAKRYISQSSGVKVVTATSGGKTTTSVQNSAGKTMTTSDLKSYITTAVESFTKGTASTDTTLNGQTLYANIKDDISHLLATNWFASKELAQGNTKGGSAAGDSYLATITTILENSLTTPNGQQILWAGGRGSGVLNKKGSTNNDKVYPYSYYGMPDDPTYQDGMYWVTGPEGEANGGKGTQFYSNAGSNWQSGNYGKAVYGYVNWDTYNDGSMSRSQPDNSAPFLTVGYGTTGKWDDAAMGGDTTVGFIKETNLANSSLNIKAGGTVNLEGDLGKAKALDTVNIESTGAVTVGTDNNNVTDYYHGTIYVDHGLYISGNGVKVGGEVHSGGTDVEATRNTDSSFSDYLDNVTINSAGNLTVHGIEVNASTDPSGKTTSRADGKGGKIKLTSTGTEGTITLGDGVDYNGQNTNGGVLKATSTANDAVVIDAQGKKSKFVNETTSTKAIDTQGKWKIYSASPEQNTFKKNLNSETDAQWTSNSTKFTANSSTENKFIFQTTPTITLYVEDQVKTYGDDVTEKLPGYMMNREEFTGVDGTLHNVNEFTDAFQEKPYTNYIFVPEGQSITVTSVGENGADGAVGTATRTGGTHAATEKSGSDGKNAVYDLNVNLNGAVAKDGYVLKNENATLEIKKRTASITGTGTQTYGDTDGRIKGWKDTRTNIAKGNTVTYDTSVKSGSKYTDNQKGRNTADFGTYENSVSFDSLKIKDANGNEVNIADNYDLTTTGTIDVAKAKLTVNTEGKTTTYGTVDEDYKSSLDKATQALNGDKEADLLEKLGLTYTIDPKDSAYIDSDGDGKYDRTNHVKYASNGKDYDSYKLDVANANTLNNYDVTVNDSTVTLKRAQATVDTDKVTTDYGTVDTRYTSHFNTAVNGDNGDELLKQLDLSYSTDAYKDAEHTNNVKDGGYDLKVRANGSLTYNDYDVKVNDSNVTLNKVNLTVNPEDIHRIYGQATEVQEDAKTAYHLSGFANGDTKDTVDATNKDGKTINQLVTVTNDVSEALKDENTHTQNASTDGYDIKTTATGDLTNYNIVIGDSKKVYLDKAELVIDTAGGTKNYGDVAGVQADLDKAASFHVKGSGETTVNGDDEKNIRENLKIAVGSNALQDNGTRTNDVKDGGYDITVTDYAKELQNYKVETGTVGKEKLNRVDLYVDSNNLTKSYGDSQGVLDGLDSKERNTLTGLVNGDDKKEDSIRTDIGIKNNSPAVYTKDGKSYTKDVGDYEIQTALTHQTITNYNVKTRNAGKVTLTPVAITVDNEMIQTYGSKDRSFKEVVDPGLVNGDKISTDGLKMAPKAGGKYETNKGNRTTADAGTYEDDLAFSGGGIVHADGTTDASKNYKVTIKGDIIVNKAPLYVNTDDILTYYGVVKNTQSRVTGLTNGDQADGIQYGYGDYGHGYLNGNTTTNMPGNYAFGTSLSGPDFLKNYNIIGGNANLQIIQSKPDQTTHYVEGAHRPQDKLESALPVFRVDASGVVKQYGTYGIESQSQAVTLSPTGMRMPEPNQTSTQDRKYLTTLKTAHGHGTFRLEYNGVVLRVIPVDPAAEQIVTDGDKMKNVALSEQALHAAYTQMGLDLVNLKGVYIYMAPM